MRLIAFVLFAGLTAILPAQTSKDPLQALTGWLALPAAERPPIAEQAFAKVAISKVQAEKARDLLIADLEARLRPEREDEWKKKEIRLGERVMKFDYRVFGEAPAGGRSLFISMHGGGATSKAVNDDQWRNQIRLYQPEEGVYLAPRAPTDTWNLWHEAHIDAFFDRIIEDAVLFAGVNVDRVYLLGYSAGGDGVFQLAPRMADRFAAAAMMAGHPNETQPLGLRNLPFTIHMGAEDSAFDRNKVAARWKKELAALHKEDPEGYTHEVVIHPYMGHWMEQQDRVALPWMARHTRNRRPQRVVWLQDDVLHDRFYWLGMNRAEQEAGAMAVARISGQTLAVDGQTTATSLTLFLDDELLDLDKPVTLVRPDGKKEQLKLDRTIAVIASTLQLDSASVYCSRHEFAIK